jgi:hypothetical protein
MGVYGRSPLRLLPNRLQRINIKLRPIQIARGD